MRLHLGVGVGHSVCAEDLIVHMLESVIKRQHHVRFLLLRIQLIRS